MITVSQRVERATKGLRCPRCESTNTAKVPVSKGRWQMGAHYCKDCDHQAYWGEFCDPPVRILTVGDKMDTEAGVVIDKDHKPIFWHLPDGRSWGVIPDSRTLWDVLWEHRERIQGVAHTHPFDGEPWPSNTDVTTFAAIEAALGRRLTWWIVTVQHFGKIEWVGPDRHDYEVWSLITAQPAWAHELRRRSCSERALADVKVMVGGPPSE